MRSTSCTPASPGAGCKRIRLASIRPSCSNRSATVAEGSATMLMALSVGQSPIVTDSPFAGKIVQSSAPTDTLLVAEFPLRMLLRPRRPQNLAAPARLVDRPAAHVHRAGAQLGGAAEFARFLPAAALQPLERRRTRREIA